MKKTNIQSETKIKLNDPILIEGLPGLGIVGKIATRYIIRQLKAKKLAELYSPHFPYYVHVDKKGNVRLLRGVFYFWKNPSGDSDLILLTGDSQAQTIEGQYEVANSILDFAEKAGVKLIITLGGYRREAEEEPKVVAVSNDQTILKEAIHVGAIPSFAGNPIVGTAGLILGLAKFRTINAVCLLAETRGYLPDPKAAKSILLVLKRLLNFEVDLSWLEKEIEKSEEIVEKMVEIEKRRERDTQNMRRMEEERITYIS